MSMLEIKNEKLSEALKKLRELYPDDSLGDAIIMAVDRIKKAEEACKKYSREAMRAKEEAYHFDKRYCDILVEKRKLTEKVGKLKAQLNTIYGQSIHAMYRDRYAKDFSSLMYEVAKSDPTRVIWETKTFIFKWPYEQDFEAQLAKFVEDLKNNKAAEIIKVSKCTYDVDGRPFAVLMFKIPTGFKEEEVYQYDGK